MAREGESERERERERGREREREGERARELHYIKIRNVLRFTELPIVISAEYSIFIVRYCIYNIGY